MSRTEFGYSRTTCGCKTCVQNCQYLPGYLIPADLDRLIPAGADPFVWASIHLDASLGALVMDRRTGRKFRVPTLVPRTAWGSMACHWLDESGRCTVHEAAPFGCAHFSACDDTSISRDNHLSVAGLSEVAKAHAADPPSLYARIWQFLYNNGYRSAPPEVKRAALRAAESGQ